MSPAMMPQQPGAENPLIQLLMQLSMAEGQGQPPMGIPPGMPGMMPPGGGGMDPMAMMMAMMGQGQPPPGMQQQSMPPNSLYR